MNVLSRPRDRRNIYYWKCDRPAAFHGTAHRGFIQGLEAQLAAALHDYFGGAEIALAPGGGTGNHLTFVAQINGEEAFIRVEDGPEGDDYLEVESHVLGAVAAVGVPAPRVLGCDATRQETSFAWQALQRIPHPDLNSHHKAGALPLEERAREIGGLVARWQRIGPARFGPFDPTALRREARLQGLHARYVDYFYLKLEHHLIFLVNQGFLAQKKAAAIQRALFQHWKLLELPQACLVHKDLALWNLLGPPERVAAVIDWDDAIAGDPMDDLSLLGCFFDGPVIAAALQGYASARSLPEAYATRFWLHLLRNMIVKAVIRVGAGYFQRDDAFFLISVGANGGGLRHFTEARLEAALAGLNSGADPRTLANAT